MRTNSFKFYINIYTKEPHHKYLGWGAKDLFDAKEFFLSVPFLSEEIIISALSNLESQEENNVLFPNIVLFLDEKFNRQTIDNHFER